jgi:hypothetical protein
MGSTTSISEDSSQRRPRIRRLGTVSTAIDLLAGDGKMIPARTSSRRDKGIAAAIDTKEIIATWYLV